MLKKKRIIQIFALILSALIVAGLLCFYSNLPSKDEIHITNLPQKFSVGMAGNYIDFQAGNECSAYASAYVMRHLGEPVTGSELYDDIHRIFGFVPVNSVVSLFQKRGYAAKAYHGDISTMKQRLVSGIPVIAFTRIPGDTHYVVIAGYDEDFIYLVDSISANSNADGGWYNRKLLTEEFEELWNTNMYPVKNIYIVINPL